MSEGTITTANGRTLLISDYIKENEEKTKEEDTTVVYGEDAKKFSGAIKSAFRMKHIGSLRGPEPEGVISTRHYSRGEILKEESKMSGRIRRSDDVQRGIDVLKWIMMRQGKWFDAEEIIKAFPDTKRSTMTGKLSRLYYFLASEKLIIRERKTGPGLRGKAYRYMFNAKVDDPDYESGVWYDRYLKWYGNQRKTQQAEKMRQALAKDASGTVEEKEKEVPEETSIDSMITDKIAEMLKQANIVPKGVTVKVEVEGSVKILFGFVR